MHRPTQSTMRLYHPAQGRLYINGAERARFLRVAQAAPPATRRLASILAYTGCRVSEALELTGLAIQSDPPVVTFRTLKRRAAHVYRDVPVPPSLIETLQQSPGCDQSRPLLSDGLQPIHRTTAYRQIKALMAEAGIQGRQACPKGLRHGFGVHAILSGVPLNLVQKWLGHSSIETTTIYTNVMGAEEIQLAARMWE